MCFWFCELSLYRGDKTICSYLGYLKWRQPRNAQATKLWQHLIVMSCALFKATKLHWQNIHNLRCCSSAASVGEFVWVIVCILGTTALKHQQHTMTSKLTDQGSRRPTTPVFCKVKWLFLSMESGGFSEDSERAVWRQGKAVKIF